MKPYRSSFRAAARLVIALPLAFFLSVLFVSIPAKATDQSKAADQSPTAEPAPFVTKLASDPATQAGFRYFYNMEYDKAINTFNRIAQAHPDDPYAANHLLSAVLFKELYRIGALDSELYAEDEFLTSRHLPVDPGAAQRIQQLMDHSLALSQATLETNPKDVDALYARGVAYGLRATYIGLVNKGWFAALRAALAARRDHERVLQLDPNYTDAKFIVGVDNYLVGSLSWEVRIAASVVGVSGKKNKGIALLCDAANHGSETKEDAKIALSMFLRREQRYPEAIALIDSLVRAYPKNFLVALEYANLLNAAGHGPEAIAAYRHLLEEGRNGIYNEPRLEQAAYGLGEALRGQREFQAAAEAYQQVNHYEHVDPELRDRASLAAGEMYDVLNMREDAVRQYKAVIAADAHSSRAAIARKRLKTVYRMPKG
jgi:tetratricopeptide (TPR) repeat protein